VRPAFAEVRLAAGGADLGSVPTLKSSDLFSYACPALESGVEYRWQVRLANADGSAATSWSAPARFVVALQDDTQWEGARWIGEREQSCPNWTDYDYQVKFEKVKEAFGVFFRAHSPTCGYMWQVNFVLGSPKLRPHVFTQGRAVILPAVELSPFFPNGIDPERLPGAGAAGGIGAALAVCLGAEMHAGIEAVLDAVHFAERVRGCDLVITGEGKADRQTLTGKVPFGVLQATRRHAPGIPVALLAGKVEDRDELRAAGFDAVIQVTPEESLKSNCLDKSFARENLRRAVQDLVYFRD
jgi:hypothetical protein